MESNHLRRATFAGGCFWCLEADFAKVAGVAKVISGYTGGEVENPTYEQVSGGRSGHLEAVAVWYDPGQISYQELLDIFWKHIDPTDPGGQFVDRGPQYRTAIFYHDEAQRQLAERSKQRLEQSDRFAKPVVTVILPAAAFYEAEAYHQKYYRKNPQRYSSYRAHSGRDQYLHKTWTPAAAIGDSTAREHKYDRPSDAVLRGRLTPLQYRVTRHEATEPPFENEYWDNKREGIYVDIISGEPLFSSLDKYDSGTGWPSFTKPLEPASIVEREDRSLFSVRTEVRSRYADSHLGHVFADGPPPGGLRYCLNSAALRFIAKEDLVKEGYEEYLELFSPQP